MHVATDLETHKINEHLLIYYWKPDYNCTSDSPYASKVCTKAWLNTYRDVFSCISTEKEWKFVSFEHVCLEKRISNITILWCICKEGLGWILHLVKISGVNGLFACLATMSQSHRLTTADTEQALTWMDEGFRLWSCKTSVFLTVIQRLEWFQATGSVEQKTGPIVCVWEKRLLKWPLTFCL